MTTPAPGALTPLQQAALAIKQLRARVDTLEQRGREPIAIVGLGCRFPGAANPAEYWDLLEQGRDGIVEIPPERWDVDAFYDPDPSAPGRMYTRRAGLVADIDRFDPYFFGISPREAIGMDPQQRLLLEVAWEALEDAGESPDRLRGSRTGVFIGMSSNDFMHHLIGRGAQRIDAWLGTGAAPSAAVGRLSYLLGLEGPSLAVDTACSSSLVALHQANRCLRDGECDRALVGGVNLILTPELSIAFCRAGMLSPDGRCKTFDAAADGYVRAEGCGVVVIKRLADALRDGDRVLAVVRGSAVNQDGRSSGLTVPNGSAQQRVVRAALETAGVASTAVSFVETHGTGTSIGDPIEVQALAAALGEGRAPERPLLIGAVKSQIGHVEAGAGIAGLIKVVLAIGHGRLPGQLHFNSPNPLIPWNDLPVEVVQHTRAWPDGPKVAGVSAFGFSGTNAHVVVTEAPSAPETAADHTGAPQRSMMLALSARDPAALRDLARRYVVWLRAHPAVNVADLCYTAAYGRTHWEERLAVPARSADQLAADLDAWLCGEAPPGCRRGRVSAAALANGRRVQWSAPDEAALKQASAAYVEGRTLEDGTGSDPRRHMLGLPTYPFQRQRYWPDDTPGNGPAPAIDDRAAAPERRFDVDALPFLADHRVRGAVVLPAALLVELARASATDDVTSGPVAIGDFTIEHAVVVGAGGRVVRVERSDSNGTRGAFEIRTRVTGESNGAPWTRSAAGRVVRANGVVKSRVVDLAAIAARCDTRIDVPDFYHGLGESGIGLGPAFQTIATLWRGSTDALSRIVLPPGTGGAEQRRTLFVDGALQTLGALLPRGAKGQAFLPVAIARLAWAGDDTPSGDDLFCHATLERADDATADSRTGDVTLFDAAGAVRLRATGVRVRRIATEVDGVPARAAQPRLHDYRVELTQPGSIDGLRLAGWTCPPPRPGEVQVGVSACGLNFRDVVGVLGLVPGYDGLYGGECAGRIRAVGEGVTRFSLGDAVFGFAQGCVGARVNVDAQLLVAIPAGLSDEDAATLPVSFVTASYALERLAELRPGERVLIHSAAGGLGSAAVQVARAVGAEVFATASRSKWEHLRTIGVRHLADSRAPDFADTIRRHAGARGVDVVLNSLAAERIGDSLSLLTRGGRFIEVGQTDIWSSERMAAERPDVAYHVIQLDRMLAERPELAGALLTEVVERAAAGRIQALPRQAFAVDEVRSAFRAMQQGRNIGKVILTMPPDGVTEPLDRSSPTVHAQTPKAQRDHYVHYVRELTARILGWDADRLPDPQTGFLDLGLDSLLAVELRNRLQRDLGPAVALPATIGFDYPTIEALGEYLAAQLAPAGTDGAAPATVAAARAEPIAIVGMACRFPGGVRDPEAYWRLLRDGVDAVTTIPADRATLQHMYDPDPHAPGKSYALHGAFLDEIDQFDNDFFGISPREAVSMDPQQRLLLEVSWEALEDAGVAADRAAGGNTGVFLGLCSSDYKDLLLQRPDAAVDAYLATGTSGSVAAGRVSYILGLHGPSLTIDTACSSALVAVHEACQSLRAGECETALAGGANIVLSRQPFLSLSKAKMLSATGHCHTFDAAADGYVRGEGVGVVVLRRLDDALADGDRVLAVIRGSAVNQDGRSSGLTAPNGVSQQAVIRQALVRAGVEPAQIGYLEAHGTGTPLGDPIEVQAAAAALGTGRTVDRPLLMGSVKANIGHGEGAAGVASLMKLVLALERGALPPQINVDTPNPKIDWEHLPVRVVRELSPWPDGPRLGSVSSFGFSGTNAHLVLSDAPAPAGSQGIDAASTYLLCLSAHDDGALRELAARYVDYLDADGAPDLAAICYTAVAGRRHWDERLAVAAASTAEVRHRLAEWIEHGDAPGVWRGQAGGVGDESASVDSIEEIAKRYVRGGPPQWVAGSEGRAVPGKVRLPTYPFQRRRFWYDERDARRSGSVRRVVHPLLGAAVISSDRYTFEVALDVERGAWLGDHRVLGAAVFPAAGFVEMALAAAHVAWSATGVCVEGLELRRPMVFSGYRPRHAQTVLVPDASNATSADVRIVAYDGDEAPAHPGQWTVHAIGRVRPLEAASPGISVDAARKQCTQQQDVGEFYARMAEQGLDYGPAFRGIMELKRCDAQALARIALPASARAERGEYRFHPSLFDACLQSVAAAVTGASEGGDQVWLPARLDAINVWSALDTDAECHVQLRSESQSEWVADLTIWGTDGALVARVEGLRMRPASRHTLSRLLSDDADAGNRYELRWDATPRAAGRGTASSNGVWWLIGARDETSDALRAALEARGGRCVLAAADTVTLAELRANSRGDVPVAGIVHLGALAWHGGEGEEASSLPARGRSELAALVTLLHDLAAGSTAAIRIWVLTRHAHAVGAESAVRPPATALWGLAMAASVEQPAWDPVAIDLDEATDEAVARVVDELLEPDGENRIAYRGAKRYVARLQPNGAAPADGRLPVPDGGYRLQADTKGTLEHLRLAPIDCPAPGDGEVQVSVRAAGLNFRDVLDTLGLIGRDLGPIGGECAGIVSAVGAGVAHLAVGDAVVGLAPGCFGTRVNVPAPLMAPVPRGITSVEAATIPITFTTAWLGLCEVARLGPGDRVLIHAAAGGVGLAAIQIARHVGAEIYATASPGKWAFLRALGITHIANSRRLDFAEAIRDLTGGRGVDVVLNSLSGEFIPRTLSLLAPHGRFIEIGKRGIWTSERMRAARPDVDYHIVALDQVTAEDAPAAGRLLRRVLDLVDEGTLRPLHHRVFDLREAPQAFRWMQQAGHIGKIVLRVPPEIDALPAHATYLVTGGHRGLGLATAHWLAGRGARHLVLLGRRDPDEEARAAFAVMEAQGIEVRVAVGDVSDAGALAKLLEQVRGEMPPLRGVVHAAGVLDDGVLSRQTWERFERVWAPKAQGAWNLHRLTRHDDLDFFVLYSSVTSVLGSAGQSNYSAANAFLDGLVGHRKSNGVPATGINWGPWAEIGMSARLLASAGAAAANRGINLMPPDAALASLGRLLREGSSQTLVAIADWARYAATLPGETPPLLAKLVRSTGDAVSAERPADSDLRRRILEAPERERLRMLTDHVARETATVLGKGPSERPNLRTGFLDLGMDSLMAVELCNRLQQTLGDDIELPPTLIFDFPSVEQLGAYLAEQLFTPPTAVPVSAPRPGNGTHGEVDDLSDDELRAKLGRAVSDILDG